MKRNLENIIIVAVMAVFGVIVYLVVSYNTIPTDVNIADAVPLEYSGKKDKKEQTKEYLEALESYGNDQDVEVDPTKERHVNTVKVKAEVKETDVDKVVETDEKKAYEKALENYDESENRVVAEETEKETLEDIPEQAKQNGDTIASDLDAIIGE